MHRILIVEDDENLRIALQDNLIDEGYEVEEAKDGATARTAVAHGHFDVIVLDIMLPDTDGYTLCKAMRADGVKAGVLMLTARTLEEDIVRGLDAGADDYLVKPYRLRELLARVRALLRRSASVDPVMLRCGEFHIDTAAREVVDGQGRPVRLTRTEFHLLCYLLQNPGRALTRNQILDNVWGGDVVVDDRTVDNFISSLKKKLRWTPDSGFRIKTVRGVGYRMEPGA